MLTSLRVPTTKPQNVNQVLKWPQKDKNDTTMKCSDCFAKHYFFEFGFLSLELDLYAVGSIRCERIRDDIDVFDDQMNDSASTQRQSDSGCEYVVAKI